MEIEIVDFYAGKINKSVILGTLHIYLPKFSLDIRGVVVKAFKDKFFFMMPVKRGYDVDEKKEITYSIVDFSDSKIKEEILDFLHKNAPAFIKKKIANSPKFVRVLPPGSGSAKNKHKSPFKKQDRSPQKKLWTFSRAGR